MAVRQSVHFFVWIASSSKQSKKVVEWSEQKMHSDGYHFRLQHPKVIRQLVAMAFVSFTVSLDIFHSLAIVSTGKRKRTYMRATKNFVRFNASANFVAVLSRNPGMPGKNVERRESKPDNNSTTTTAAWYPSDSRTTCDRHTSQPDHII